MAALLVIDNKGVSSPTSTNAVTVRLSGPTNIWITGGAVSVEHYGAAVLTISATTDRKALRLGVGESVTVYPTASSTTCYMVAASGGSSQQPVII